MNSEPVKSDEWIPQYRNDSREWLVCEAVHKTNWEIPSSVSKSTFVTPDTRDFRPIGRRKKLFRKFFINEVQHELVVNDEPTIPTYQTEYMGRFNHAHVKENFNSSNDGKIEECFPLYTNEPGLSFWQQNVSNIPGLTKPCSSKHLFHKNIFFTKPIDEVLDDPFAPYTAKVSVNKWHQLHLKFGYK